MSANSCWSTLGACCCATPCTRMSVWPWPPCSGIPPTVRQLLAERGADVNALGPYERRPCTGSYASKTWN